jgi:hypothetical protein
VRQVGAIDQALVPFAFRFDETPEGFTRSAICSPRECLNAADIFKFEEALHAGSRLCLDEILFGW